MELIDCSRIESLGVFINAKRIKLIVGCFIVYKMFNKVVYICSHVDVVCVFRQTE